MAIMPDRLKLPDSKYDGTGDPADHLENYRSWMELNSATNAFKCRAFVITLTGVARRWFPRDCIIVSPTIEVFHLPVFRPQNTSKTSPSSIHHHSTGK